MTKTIKRTVKSSAEGVIDRRSERLAAKLVAGTASDVERFELRELAVTRSNMMVRPPRSFGIPLSKVTRKG